MAGAFPEFRKIIGEVMPLALKRTVSFEEVKAEVDVKLIEDGHPINSEFDLRPSASIMQATLNIAKGLCSSHLQQ